MSKEQAIIDLKECCWKDVRDRVSILNPTVAKIIDEIDPGKSYPLYKATYSFGSHLLSNGKFCLPCKDGSFVLLNDRRVPARIQEKLGYNAPINPIFILLNRPMELTVPLQDRIIPYFLILPGNLFGAWKILEGNLSSTATSYDPCGMWDITSGARSIFMLPKISENIGHHKLQKIFHFTIDKPNNLKDHWNIFRALYNHPNFKDTWEAEVIFFSNDWFKGLDDKAWRDFKLYLLDYNWKNSSFWRGQYVWYLTLSRIQATRGIKPSPYHSDIVKHLFAIGVGALPGFAPAIDDSLAPIHRIQEIYQNLYGLKQWAPIIMQPTFFNSFSSKQPVYYSLQFQSAMELSPKSSKRSSALADTYMVSALIEKYLQDVQKGYLNVERTPLFELSKSVQYDFFHDDPGNYPRIKSCATLPKEDPVFGMAMKYCDNSSFPQYSSFFSGCARVQNLLTT